MSREVLTGRRRYREQKRLFRHSLMVLQVEYDWYVEFVERDGSGWTRQTTHWRDATVSDLMTIPANIIPFDVVKGGKR